MSRRTSPRPPGPSPDLTGGMVGEMVLSQERLRVGTRWTPTETVTASTRIVTETLQVEVTVRREELVITRTPVTDGRAVTALEPYDEPVVIVLYREVPTIVLDTEAYERVVLTVGRVDGTEDVTATLAKEQLVAEGTPGVTAR